MKLFILSLSVLSAFCSAALTPLEGENPHEKLSSSSSTNNLSENFDSNDLSMDHEKVVKLLNNLLGGLGEASQKIESPEAPSDALKKSLMTGIQETHKYFNFDSVNNSDWQKIFKDALGDKENFGKYLKSDSISEMFPQEILDKISQKYIPSTTENDNGNNKAFRPIDKSLADIWGTVSKENIAEMRKRFMEKVDQFGQGKDLAIEDLFYYSNRDQLSDL